MWPDKAKRPLERGCDLGKQSPFRKVTHLETKNRFDRRRAPCGSLLGVESPIPCPRRFPPFRPGTRNAVIPGRPAPSAPRFEQPIISVPRRYRIGKAADNSLCSHEKNRVSSEPTLFAPRRVRPSARARRCLVSLPKRIEILRDPSPSVAVHESERLVPVQRRSKWSASLLTSMNSTPIPTAGSERRTTAVTLNTEGKSRSRRTSSTSCPAGSG